MYNHAQASYVKILERADNLALSEMKNQKVSVKQKQTFATVKLEQLMNYAAKYFQNFLPDVQKLSSGRAWCNLKPSLLCSNFLDYLRPELLHL